MQKFFDRYNPWASKGNRKITENNDEVTESTRPRYSSINKEEYEEIAAASQDVDTETTSCSFNFSSYLSKFSDSISKDLAIVLIINLSRDVVWTMLSILKYDAKFKPDKNDNQEMLGQLLYSTLAMVATGAALGVYFAKKSTFTRADLMKISIAIAAAAAAVITWDEGQTLGINIGQEIFGTNSTEANSFRSKSGYFASIFTGGFEGPTQYLVGLVGTFLLLPQDRRDKYTNAPGKGFVRFMAELGFSVVPGLFGGGIWQIIYNLNPFNLVHADTAVAKAGKILGNSSAVGAGVFACNFFYAKAYDNTIGRCFPTEEDVIKEFRATTLM